MKKFAFAVLALAVLVVGTAMAVDPINATLETQGISTSTGVIVMGTMTNTETVVMTASNMDMRDNPPLQRYIPVYDENGDEVEDEFTWAPERQAVFSYTESILADNGYAEFNEMQSMDTGNKVANQDNFKSTEQYDYVAFSDAMGRTTNSESMLLDLASQGSNAANRFICPFATGDAGFIPAYCNVYEMGSSFTGSQVSMITQGDTNFIAKSADVPTQIAYSVGLSGTGSAAAWINAHVMEGRTAGVFEDATDDDGDLLDYRFVNYDFPRGGDFMQGVDLVYKEKTTASGVIESFSKSMSVQDAVRRL
ncbi:MAG: hypothetical protein A4E41_00184 [Methanoregulaceae archaeon PtaU1.Bin066]|nr:MAG: hypothetical protein A4E41_00184 [Methanoregulaceae archaeon PtaU1.Bin066]